MLSTLLSSPFLPSPCTSCLPFCSHGQSDVSKQRLSLSFTPKLLSRWFARHNSTIQERSMVYFPLATTVNVTEMLVRYGADYHVHTHSRIELPLFSLHTHTQRSPGAIPKFRRKSTLPSPAAEVAYVSKKDQPSIAKQLYTPLPGQVWR